MAKILVGTSSWANPSLIESGLFYPPEVKSPAARLGYYSERFPIAEIAASFHYFPTRQNVALWLENTPAGFVFDIRAFSLFTGHPTPPHSLPRSIREEYQELDSHKGNLYQHHLPENVLSRIWEILALLHQHQLSLVCVDEPQGMRSSVPPVAEVTSPVGMVRFHGRNAANWEKSRLAAEERFQYLYSEDELRGWPPAVRRMAKSAEEVHVIFKNKFRDFAIRNARKFAGMLE